VAGCETSASIVRINGGRGIAELRDEVFDMLEDELPIEPPREKRKR
jgi:hypothetical protein